MLAKHQFKQGIKQGIPIMLAYFPIAITYGVIASQAGLSLLELTSMSILVYGGAAQFMAINMLSLHISAIKILLFIFFFYFFIFFIFLVFYYFNIHILFFY